SRASTLIAAPPASKLASICAVTSDGYALTASAATPWSAAATTIAQSGRAGTATPWSAPMRTATSSMAPRLRRGFVWRSKAACVSDIREFQRLAGDDEVGVVGGRSPRGVDPAEHVPVRPPERRGGNDAEADLVRYGDRRAAPRRDGHVRVAS